jgi:hypothetical protein
MKKDWSALGASGSLYMPRFSKDTVPFLGDVSPWPIVTKMNVSELRINLYSLDASAARAS